MADFAVYASLFATALLAATVFPAQSEAVLASLLLMESYSIGLLLATASAGNVLGAVLNWLLGRALERWHERSWFAVRPQLLERAQRWYRRYGKWSLLLSWMPIIGDPLTIVAGALREPFMTFLTLVTIAKAGRYLLLAAIVLNWF